MSKYVILMLMIEVMVMANRFLPTDNEIQQESHENSVNQKNSQEFQNLMDHSLSLIHI